MVSLKYELNMYVCVCTEYDYHHVGPSSILGQSRLDCGKESGTRRSSLQTSGFPGQ